MMDEEADVDERTLWCGNLSDKVTEELLYELFHQAGPVEKVRIRSDQGRQYTYGFVTYRHACSCEYAAGVFSQTKLYGRLLNIQKRTRLNNSNGQYGNDSVLQQPNNLLHLSNLQFMTPQQPPAYAVEHFPGQDLYYATPGRYNRNSPPRRSPPHHRSSRNEHRSHKHYDEPKSSHGHNHHNRHRKRHKK